MITQATPQQEVRIDFLYLDLGQCGRCRNSRTALEAALEATHPALAAMGRSVVVRDTHVTSLDQARRENFVASPTIRIDGRDIQPEALTSRCRECGDLCDCADGVDCREWAWDGAHHTAAPVALIVERIMAAALKGPAPGDAEAENPLPPDADDRNLRRFFAGAPVPAACCARSGRR